MKTIPQRELRNRVSRVLREVEGGQRMRVTVDGRPVADLIPIQSGRQRFVSREHIVALLGRAPLDRNFQRDISALDATIDEE